VLKKVLRFFFSQQLCGLFFCFAHFLISSDLQSAKMYVPVKKLVDSRGGSNEQTGEMEMCNM
jgi:hypothetical protein